MEESVIYQEILEKGVLQERQDGLIEFGADILGIAPPDVQTRVKSIQDLDRLQRMRKRLRRAKDWNDLLATP